MSSRKYCSSNVVHGGGIRENFVKISIIAKILDHRKRNVFLCLGHKEPEVRRYSSSFSPPDLFMKIPDVYLEIPIEALLCPWYQDILKKKNTNTGCLKAEMKNQMRIT